MLAEWTFILLKNQNNWAMFSILGFQSPSNPNNSMSSARMAFLILISQMRKLKLTEFKLLAQDHTV